MNILTFCWFVKKCKFCELSFASSAAVVVVWHNDQGDWNRTKYKDYDISKYC